MPTIKSEVSLMALVNALVAYIYGGVSKSDVCLSDAEALENCAKIIRGVLQPSNTADAQSVAVYCGGCGYTHKPGVCPDDSSKRR